MSFFKIFHDAVAGSGKIESFKTINLRTSGMRGSYEREIVMKGSEAEVSQYGIRYNRENEERILEKRTVCSKETVLKLLNDCKLLSWDGFDGKHPRGVKDGTMFTLKAEVNEGKIINAQGSQNFPAHYRDLTDGIYEILNEK